MTPREIEKERWRKYKVTMANMIYEIVPQKRIFKFFKKKL